MRQIKTAVFLLIFFIVLTGFIYPIIVTIFAQVLFPWQATGSIIEQDGKPIGSLLIGQSFTSAKYFWSRPSATQPFPYNAENSAGSNLGPLNPAFFDIVKARILNLHNASPQTNATIPVNLVTASGSGLDPDISPAAAYYQIPRIAKTRGIPVADIQALLEKSIKRRVFGIFGELRVNVLQLNLDLDRLTKEHS
jgi:K+-transporting ATPase ATPase C chain